MFTKNTSPDPPRFIFRFFYLYKYHFYFSVGLQHFKLNIYHNVM